MSAGFVSACSERASDVAALSRVEPPRRPSPTALSILSADSQHRQLCGTVKIPWLTAAVTPSNPNELHTFVKLLKALQEVHANVLCYMEESGEHILAATRDCSARYLMSVIDWLHAHAAEEALSPLQVGNLSIAYCETVSAASHVVMSKSPNKHSRLYASASPLEAHPSNDGKPTQRVIASAPENCDAMLANARLVNNSRTAPSPDVLRKVEGGMSSALRWVCGEGPLADGPVLGVQWTIEDMKIHVTPRSCGGQYIPMARRVLLGAMLEAQPRFVEPWLTAEAPRVDTDACARLLAESRRHAAAVEWRRRSVDHAPVLRTALPAAACLGQLRDLVLAVTVPSRCTFTFAGWRVLPGDPLPPRGQPPPTAPAEPAAVETLQAVAAAAVGTHLADIAAADRCDVARDVLDALPPHLSEAVGGVARGLLDARDDARARQLLGELRRAKGLREATTRECLTGGLLDTL